MCVLGIRGASSLLSVDTAASTEMKAALYFSHSFAASES